MTPLDDAVVAAGLGADLLVNMLGARASYCGGQKALIAR